MSGDGPIRLGLRPLLTARPHEAPVDHPLPPRSELVAQEGRLEVRLSQTSRRSACRCRTRQERFTVDALTVQHLYYRVEESRGYQAQGDAWSPGYFRVDLEPAQIVTFVASTESWETMTALPTAAARDAEIERRRRLLVAADPVLADSPRPS